MASALADFDTKYGTSTASVPTPTSALDSFAQMSDVETTTAPAQLGDVSALDSFASMPEPETSSATASTTTALDSFASIPDAVPVASPITPEQLGVPAGKDPKAGLRPSPLPRQSVQPQNNTQAVTPPTTPMTDSGAASISQPVNQVTEPVALPSDAAPLQEVGMLQRAGQKLTAKAAEFGVGLADTAKFFGPMGMSTGRHIMDMVTGEKKMLPDIQGKVQAKWESAIESFKAKLDPTIQAERTRFAQELAVTMKEGGTLPAVALQVSEAVWNTAIDLIAMKYATGGMPGGVGKKAAQKAAQALPSISRATRWLTGAKATLRHAGALATYRAMVTPGDAKAKAESAAVTMAYMATPAISGGMPGAALAKFFDFTLNSGITIATGQYKDAVTQAKTMAADDGKKWESLNNAGKASYIAVTATPMAVTDAYFSLLTKSFTSKGATRQAMATRLGVRMQQERANATTEAARMETEYSEVATMARKVAELREEMHADADARTSQPNRTTEAGTSEDISAHLREQAARIKEDRAPNREMRANEVEGLRILREMRGETAPTPARQRPEPIKSLDQLDPSAFLDERATPPTPDTPAPPAPTPETPPRAEYRVTNTDGNEVPLDAPMIDAAKRGAEQLGEFQNRVKSGESFGKTPVKEQGQTATTGKIVKWVNAGAIYPTGWNGRKIDRLRTALANIQANKPLTELQKNAITDAIEYTGKDSEDAYYEGMQEEANFLLDQARKDGKVLKNGAEIVRTDTGDADETIYTVDGIGFVMPEDVAKGSIPYFIKNKTTGEIIEVKADKIEALNREDDYEFGDRESDTDFEGEPAAIKEGSRAGGDQAIERGERSVEDFRREQGIAAPPDQGEMFGKGAVGDRFQLRQETAPDNAGIAREQEAAAQREAELDKKQGNLFDEPKETPARDAEYLAAVEAGDTAKAQRMVDEAAKAAGYNVGPVYRGVRGDKLRNVIAPPSGEVYFSSELATAASYGTVQRFFLSADNPMVVDGEGQLYFNVPMRAYLFRHRREGHDAVRVDNVVDTQDGRRVPSTVWMVSLDGESRSDAVGSIVPASVGRNRKTAQFKLAESVTRDDQGNVIPLSQRFQPESPDIRGTISDKLVAGAKKAAKAIDSEAKKATTRMEERAKGRMSSGLDERDLADATIRGADMVVKGATNFATWSKKMVSAIGERVRSSLSRIWQAVTSYLTRVPKYKTKLPEAKYDIPKIADTTGAVKNAPAAQPAPAKPVIPAKRGIVSRILGAFSTEQPFRDLAAPETGKAQKALASRRSMGSERAIEIVAKELNPITKGLPQEQAKDVWKHTFFKVSNPKYDKTPIEIQKQVDEAVAVINTVNKEYLALLKKEGVLNQAWPESHIARESGRWSELATEAADITDGKFRIPGVPKKLGSEETRFNLEDRRLGEIFKEMDGIAGRIEKLKSLRYIHLPSRIWMAEKSAEDPEGFDAVLSGNFSGIKGRRTLDPYDLTQIKDKTGQPLLNPDKVDAREALALYVRYVEGQRAQAEIRRTATAEGLVKKTDAAPSDWAKPDVEKFPMFAGKKLHPAFYDLLKGYYNASGKNSTLNKLFTYMKMQNFINPIIMPMYDTFQAVALTQGRAILPWNLWRAYKDAMGNTENYRQASWFNLFSKPDAAPFKDFQEQLQRQLKGGGLDGWVKTELDRLVQTGEKLPKKAALLLPRITRDIYHGMWFTAWKGDQILRMASYNVMRKQGFSPQDSARLAAEAHADYAGVPKASRKTLNKIFFTPTFQISMMKWAARQMMAPAKVATAQLKKAMGKNTSIDTKIEVQRSLTLLTSMAMLGGMHYLITNLLGWETEEWGRKYKKEVTDPDTGEKKEVVVSFANPINVPLKYYHQFIRRRDGTTKPEQIAKYGQFLIHPMYRLLINIAQNKRPNGEPIVDQFDSPAKVAIDWSHYVSGQMVTLYREILDKPETTEAKAFKLLRENDQPKLDQAMRTIAFGYVRGEESNRVKYKTTRMFQQFSSGLRQNPPKNVKQLESRYNRLLKTLDRFEKEAKTDELRLTLMKSQNKAMKNMAIDVAIFSGAKQYTEQEYEIAQKIKRRG